LLGGIDEIVETGFGQTHCGNLEKYLLTLKRRKIRASYGECKGYRSSADIGTSNTIPLLQGLASAQAPPDGNSVT
jgi:hypothetical protein